MISFVDGALIAVSNSLLASIIVKATLILAFTLLVARLTRRCRASMRHAILSAAFGVLMLLPVASTLAIPFRIALPVSPRAPIALAPLATTADIVMAAVTPHEGAGAAILRSSELSLQNLLFGVWLVGAGLFLLPAIIGLWQVRCLRRSGLPWLVGQNVADGLAPDARIQRRIEVLLHESLAGPITCGVLDPAIVFPPDAPDWQEAELNRAMVHELEHVRRCDWIWHCLARVVCSLYWFHPLAWIAWRQLTVDAERACDDAVLRRSEPMDYADQLVGLARRLSVARKSPVLAMANRSDLLTRIGALLDTRQQRGRAGAMQVTLAGVTAAVLAIAISPLRMVAAPQSNSSPSAQKFEVASVRLEDPHDPRSSPEYTNDPGFRTVATVFPSNRLTIRHTGLRSLISDAFEVNYRYVLGGPDWLANQHYDLSAKVDGSAPLTREQMRPLMRNLLEERFHLKVHRERKIVPGYALVIANGGSRLQANKGAPFQGIFGGPTFKGQNFSVERLAQALADLIKQPVVDKTGIVGTYDFDLKIAPRDLAADDPRYANLPDIFFVLQDQLGLKLVPEKVTIDTLVIDHVDKVPTEN